MRVEQVVPVTRTLELAELSEMLGRRYRPALPFSPEIVDFTAALSQAIFRDRDASAYPELQALAFWMRKAEVMRLKQDFEQYRKPGLILAPRGLAFHIPPANVDTMFMYSWLIAALTGNRSVIRLSLRAAPQAELLYSILNRVLAGAPDTLRESTMIVRYGHESEITDTISSHADVRVIWGGDATVREIRKSPLPPHAKEITFPDRFSLCLMGAREYLDLDAAGAQDLTNRFFNDAFWFDQLACSSPRVLIWRGEDANCRQAGRLFFDRLATDLERRSHLLPADVWLQKFTFACRTILERPVLDYSERAGAAMLGFEELNQVGRDHCGGGLFFQTRVLNARDIVAFVDRRDQTLTYFGIREEELRSVAEELAGRGIDRMVPVGRALQFHRYWDGYDLLAEFTRGVHMASA
jgi:hypothetical protein